MLGLGKKGDLKIELEKTSFSPGETIAGKVTLTLNKPQKAKEFSITFFGEEETTEWDEDGQQQTEKSKVYEFKETLDGEKEYPGGQELSYNFEIKIPADLFTGAQPPPGMLGKVAQVLKYMSGNRGIVYWYLAARLDIPWGIDVKETIRIAVG